MSKVPALEEIIRFQTDRDLDKKAYNCLNEQVSVLEELLEAEGYNVPKNQRPALKDEWTAFKQHLEDKGIATDKHEPTWEEKVDAHCDIIVFSVGALLKLGVNIFKALFEASKEINSRTGSMVDGKFEKDLSPEAKAKWYKADYNTCKAEA